MANDEENSVEGVRLQKVLASAGVASRRVCEQLIVAGKVRVNNKVVTELGTRINPEVDKVAVNGNPIQLDSSRVYLALNKPFGVVSSMHDENGRPDLAQFVVEYDRVYNVGRLDAETTGLIIMTNDGDLAHKLAHPKFGVRKTYLARVEGLVEPKTIAKLINPTIATSLCKKKLAKVFFNSASNSSGSTIGLPSSVTGFIPTRICNCLLIIMIPIAASIP